MYRLKFNQPEYYRNSFGLKNIDNQAVSEPLKLVLNEMILNGVAGSEAEAKEQIAGLVQSVEAQGGTLELNGNKTVNTRYQQIISSAALIAEYPNNGKPFSRVVYEGTTDRRNDAGKSHQFHRTELYRNIIEKSKGPVFFEIPDTVVSNKEDKSAAKYYEDAGMRRVNFGNDLPWTEDNSWHLMAAGDPKDVKAVLSDAVKAHASGVAMADADYAKNPESVMKEYQEAYSAYADRAKDVSLDNLVAPTDVSKYTGKGGKGGHNR